jgi:putative N6-adenine-specific DNA methylase
MYAWDMAPGLGRSFAVSDLLLGDPQVERTVREAYLAQVDFERTVRIYGSDADERAVALAKSNLQRAYELALGRRPLPGIRPELRLPGMPEFRLIPLREARAPEQTRETGGGFIITNPPYGRRLGTPEAAEAVYHEMSVLTGHFPGWKLGLITDHPGFESHFGKKADSCREITNGAIPSFFYEYEQL